MDVRQLSPVFFDTLRQFLSENGFEFKDRPYQSGKLVFNASDSPEYSILTDFLNRQGIESVTPASPKKQRKPDILSADINIADLHENRIGTDESGKGDYFGPLIVCGVMVSYAHAEQLKEIGVIDSKQLTEARVRELAAEIRTLLPKQGVSLISIPPETYNRLYQKMQNLNAMLGWAHAKAIENLLDYRPDCTLAIADKFGNERYIKTALQEKGKNIRLIQVPRAERDVAVAAASVLAREKLLIEMTALSKMYRIRLPKGAVNVIPTARNFVAHYGKEELGKVAKLHFSTTLKVLATA
ncbi:hypothetical protein CHS0354_035282 [Potamilus streckersoni]|uniref:Ribonuclease n=1 Tax=Potamilus streckersoni TaxID=2493646 RepID=A0AAE0S2Q1_9BIVA|nr:hypothetical protein CHS0354_035282 [Potamilus streckersoni]